MLPQNGAQTSSFFACLSVCDPQNFIPLIVGDEYFKFGIAINDTLSNESKVNDLMTLTFI